MNGHVVQAIIHKKEILLRQCCEGVIPVTAWRHYDTECDRQINRELGA